MSDKDKYQQIADMYKSENFGKGNPVAQELNIPTQQMGDNMPSVGEHQQQQGQEQEQQLQQQLQQYSEGGDEYEDDEETNDLDAVDSLLLVVYGFGNFLYSMASETLTLPIDKRIVASQCGYDSSVVPLKCIAKKGLQKALIASVLDTTLKTTNGTMLTSPARLLMFIAVDFPLQNMFNRSIISAAELYGKYDDDDYHEYNNDSNPKMKREEFISAGLWRSVEATVKEESLGALYNGIFPYLISNAIQFLEPFDSFAGWTLWTVGTISVCYPLLTVSARMQTDRKRRYNNVFDCVNKVLTEEGPTALYSGVGSYLVRFAATGGITIGMNFLLGSVSSLFLDESPAPF
eukprot:gb/GECH01007859.1/.p1 GENE.gb/GECH01007859.1/~~gb/GECH01007859.1/.p1  ORF type:complete len:347 (+),score=92.41 gb/GECH01007859.1/:1-1041(+)